MNLTYVVDASAIVPALVQGPNEGPSDALIQLVSGSAEIVLAAPDLIILEVTNAIWRSAAAGVSTKQQATLAHDLLMSLRLTLHDSRTLAGPALKLALDLNISAYDAAYVALGQILKAPLVSGDQKLLSKLGDGPYDTIDLRTFK